MARHCTESPDFGTTRLNFDVDGHGGFILLPTNGAKRDSWIWYAPSFVDRLPKPRHVWYVSRLLAEGFCIAGVDVGETWGCPAGREVFTRFHDACVHDFGLARHACLWCQSRGGLMHYNWAVEHPERVRCIGGVYPVVNMRPAPMLKRVLPAYDMSRDQLERVLHDHNPVDRLQPLAAAAVPVFHIHGDGDVIVPLALNSMELKNRYEALGGSAALLVIRGKGHEEVREFFESPEFVDFFVRNR